MESLPFLFDEGEFISLYLHVPFCAQKCGYCDFYSRSSGTLISEFLEALALEFTLYREKYPHLSQKKVSTIFVGGGTPSILTPLQWRVLAQLIHDNFTLASDYEWTIECNPESFSTMKVDTWIDTGVNRLSMGVQSLDNSVLKRADRIHTAETVLNVLKSKELERFDSVNCDIIYGLPGQTLTDVEQTLKTLLSFPVLKHISAYELTVAENTPFAALDISSFPDDELLADYEESVLAILSRAGFSRYEVSNYAKPGFECRHNLNYWQMNPYLGFGPSAHSYDGKYRFANIGSLTEYAELTKNGEFPLSSFEELSPEMERDEYLFLGLRTAEGISVKQYEKLYEERLYSGNRLAILEKMEQEGRVIRDGDQLRLSPEGLNLADGVALQLTQ